MWKYKTLQLIGKCQMITQQEAWVVNPDNRNNPKVTISRSSWRFLWLIRVSQTGFSIQKQLLLRNVTIENIHSHIWSLTLVVFHFTVKFKRVCNLPHPSHYLIHAWNYVQSGSLTFHITSIFSCPNMPLPSFQLSSRWLSTSGLLYQFQFIHPKNVIARTSPLDHIKL